MRGAFVMKEENLRRAGRVDAGHSVGVGSYALDSHVVSRVLDEQGRVRNEGPLMVTQSIRPYPISYHALVPRAAVDRNDLRRAQQIFREESPKSFTVDLADLTRDAWTLLPGPDDFLAEVVQAWEAAAVPAAARARPARRGADPGGRRGAQHRHADRGAPRPSVLGPRHRRAGGRNVGGWEGEGFKLRPIQVRVHTRGARGITGIDVCPDAIAYRDRS